ncbi:NAD-dependent epimerase/dehydratase family protein [Undibacterium sp. RuTC16W]|uniref:NAD-dependent epimerase/dehydratase family protein n=1 Tax=Undibacterium sp. RuTC16W TaxID=3413048 RepID=UPI003BF00F0B
MSGAAHASLIGGQGFIGRHLQAYLLESGWSCYVAEREDAALYQADLGHVFYCAGLTADFRQRPYATVEAHVQLLASILQQSRFTTLTYLSSTRVYAGATATDENASLAVRSHEPGDLYNLSKLLGESLCLSSQRPVRVVRLSNVYGENMSGQNFLSEVLAAAKQGSVRFRSAPHSQKDYIAVQDVVHYLPLIALQDKSGIYNLASGRNLSNAEIAASLRDQGVDCDFEKDAPVITFPVIDIAKLRAEFGAPQHDLANDLPQLYSHYCETL